MLFLGGRWSTEIVRTVLFFFFFELFSARRYPGTPAQQWSRTQQEKFMMGSHSKRSAHGSLLFGKQNKTVMYRGKAGVRTRKIKKIGWRQTKKEVTCICILASETFCRSLSTTKTNTEQYSENLHAELIL
jgi:hypothetical protein